MFEITRKTKNPSYGSFMEEYAQENVFYNDFVTKGVILNHEGQRAQIQYSGLLAKNGACDVYAAVAFGDNRNWQDVRYYQMSRGSRNSFEVMFPVRDDEQVNIAFKDGADHWDNNAGINYSFKLQ